MCFKMNSFAPLRVSSCVQKNIVFQSIRTLNLGRHLHRYRYYDRFAVATWPFSLPLKRFLHCNKSMCAKVIMHPSADATDSKVLAILSQKCSLELLNTLGEFEKNSLTAEHTWLLTTRLLQLHYQDMTKKISWLQSNVFVAHIQLHMRDEVRSAAMPLLIHANYPIWHDLLETNCNLFTNRQLADCFMSSLFMGFTFEDPLMQKFLFTVHDRLTDFDILSLMSVSCSLKALPGYDFLAIRKLLKQFETVINTLDPSEASGEEMAALATIWTNSLKFLSANFMQNFMEWFSKAICRDEVLQNPDHLSALMRMGQKLTLSNRLHNDMSLGIITKLVRLCYRMVDQLDTNHIAEICHSLKQCRCYDQDLAKLMEQRADSLLTEDIRLCEITNLMYALTRFTRKEVARKFEGALHSKLIRQDDVDIIILSNMADCLTDLAYVNQDLLQLFQKHVIAKADDIITFISRYNKIVKILVRHRFHNPMLEKQFMQAILRHLNHQHGLHLHSIASLSIFLLPFSYQSLPEDFFNKLIIAIPNWREVELYRLALGINSMRQPMTGLLRRQMSQILSTLHTTISNRVASIETIDYLYQLTLGLVIHNRNRDPVLTDKLMTMYPKFTKFLNDVSVMKVAQMFQRITYHLPEVYDDMVNFVVANRDTIDDSKVQYVLSTCAKVGYQPQLGEEMMKICADVLCRLQAEKNFKLSLQLLNHLSMIMLYPERELAQLFTLENIEELEKYLEVNPESAKSVEHNMMELNRSIVLECPQLDVPWFHEQYCVDNIVGTTEELSSTGERLKQDIQQALCDVLGGQKFFRNGSFSTYFHRIDFECALSKNRKPVPMNRLTAESNDNQLQKVAVCVLHENSYCYNSKQMTGKEQQRKRHLEIMGYKYVDVPYFDWYSMGMADWRSKLEYIRSKVTV